MRVLVVKTSSMGDVLHTLPAITDAYQKIPNLQIDWVVEEAFAEIPFWHVAVNQVIRFPFRRWRRHWWAKKTRAERKQFLARLTAVKYDVIIDAQGLLKSAFFVVRKAKGSKHGYGFCYAREPLASLFYKITHRVDKKQHAVERIRQLFAKSLGYSLDEGVGEYGIASHFQHHHKQDAIPYLVFLHATTRENKHWPEAYWRQLIGLLQAYDVKIKLPWGSAKEQARAMRLATGYDFVEVLPRSTLSEVAYQISDAIAVVSVDTGLSHLSAALDKPNLTLYGPTDPGLIGGYGKNQQVCKLSDQMNDIQPEWVLKQLAPILNRINK